MGDRRGHLSEAGEDWKGGEEGGLRWNSALLYLLAKIYNSGTTFGLRFIKMMSSGGDQRIWESKALPVSLDWCYLKLINFLT